MSENLKTIKELADELGVSKQAVWQKIKRETSIDLRQFTSTKGNTVYVDVDGQKAIKQLFVKKSSTEKRQHEEKVDDNKEKHVDDIQTGNEIEFLRNLVLEIQNEKKELHKLLDQQQRLALQDKKLLEEYKSEINDLKALKTPLQDTKMEQVDNQPQEEVEALKTELEVLQEQLQVKETTGQQEVPKQWWQFWK